MKLNLSQINSFFKRTSAFRETTGVADYFFLPYVAHINRLHAPDASDVHTQRNFEVSLLLSGNMSYSINDKEQIFEAGDVLIIPPDVRHGWRVLSESIVFSFMINISRCGDGTRRSLEALFQAIVNRNYRVRNFIEFNQIIQQMIDEISSPRKAYEDKVLYLMKIGFIELIRTLLPGATVNSTERNMPPIRGDKGKNIQEMVHLYIQDNINRAIILQEISDYVGLSSGYLNMLFKKENGITINQAIINKKMEWACRYLVQTDRQVKDIAALVGYDNVNYFYLQFKRKYGVTPSAYRRINV